VNISHLVFNISDSLEDEYKAQLPLFRFIRGGESGGIWKPLPGLIYPMLGRLIEEGLIDQMDDGRYKITTKGLDMIKDLESVHNVFQKQFGRYYFGSAVLAGSWR